MDNVEPGDSSQDPRETRDKDITGGLPRVVELFRPQSPRRRYV